MPCFGRPMQSIPSEIFDTRGVPPVKGFHGIRPATPFPLPVKRKKFRSKVRIEDQKFEQESDVFS